MEINPVKCGIRVEPPGLVIVYKTNDEKKLKRKIIPLKKYTPFVDVDVTFEKLRQRNDLKQIPSIKIKKMIRLLQEITINGKTMEEGVEIIKNDYELKLNENLNKLSTKELNVQKELMDTLFIKNQIKKDDVDFVYDKRIQFSGEKINSDWDFDLNDNNNNNNNEDFWT
ncbi:conserved hypothetical protein [Pediculus humanus corporis]|uniref:Centrosomal protein of 19 kDa n=1 Tax=Pediculus humanus subsp. corporis TaxID=121224 RepID=E0VB16_PEDHC|nr:uncharacterized protein Phum_PHUM049600 [Pediculus humanus corporis]EEB10572.1 conserved hypothetical protein [Pediculus humanus corporis]